MNAPLDIQGLIEGIRQQIVGLETFLHTLLGAHDRHETMELVVRTAHGVKATAEVLGMEKIVNLVLAAEGVLAGMRDDAIPPTVSIVALLLRWCERIGVLLEGYTAPPLPIAAYYI